jgi:hypothetical protein
MDKNFELKRFGIGYAYKLVNSQIKGIIMDKLEKYYRLKLFVPFGKTYKTIKSKVDMSDVQDYGHLVNFNMSTNLSYLYLTEYNGIRFCYYIVGTDRSNVELYSTVQRFNGKLFSKETLLEGYILDIENDPIFLVEDLVIYEGHTVNKNLEERVKLMNNLLDFDHRTDPVLDNFRIILKDYVDYTYIMSFMSEYLQTLSYRSLVTGLVFSPLGSCVIHLIASVSMVLAPVSGFNSEAKLKSDPESSGRFEIIASPKKRQACFLVCSTDKPDVYHLYLASSRGALKYYDIASIPDSVSSTHVGGLFKGPKKSGIVMVCKYDDRAHIRRWQPEMVSNRKTPDTIYKLRA